MSIILNIGQQVGTIVPHGQMVHTLKFVAELFEPLMIRTELRMSNTELTMVVELETTVTNLPNRVHTLCLALHQDAIAWTTGHGDIAKRLGFLTGPKAADWGGEFNHEFFLNPSWY